AWDPHLACEVALKVVARDTNVDASVVEEARLLARVRHPNIVCIYGADRWNGQVGLRMELVRGPTLKQVLKAQGTLGGGAAAPVGGRSGTPARRAVPAAGCPARSADRVRADRREGDRSASRQALRIGGRARSRPVAVPRGGKAGESPALAPARVARRGRRRAA